MRIQITCHFFDSSKVENALHSELGNIDLGLEMGVYKRNSRENFSSFSYFCFRNACNLLVEIPSRILTSFLVVENWWIRQFAQVGNCKFGFLCCPDAILIGACNCLIHCRLH